MNISDVLSLLGLVLSVWGSIILVKHIFISDKEIEDLSEIPIEPSTTRFTSAVSENNLSGALTDVQKIKQYRTNFIQRRKEERTNGKKGLRFIIIGFIVQAIALLM